MSDIDTLSRYNYQIHSVPNWTELELYFLYFYRTRVYLGSDLWARVSLIEMPFAGLTLADEDTNSKLNYKAIVRAIQRNMALWQCK